MARLYDSFTKEITKGKRPQLHSKATLKQDMWSLDYIHTPSSSTSSSSESRTSMAAGSLGPPSCPLDLLSSSLELNFGFFLLNLLDSAPVLLPPLGSFLFNVLAFQTLPLPASSPFPFEVTSEGEGHKGSHHPLNGLQLGSKWNQRMKGFCCCVVF